MDNVSTQNQSTIQDSLRYIHDLTIDSVLRELPSYHVAITPKTLGMEAAELLENDQDLPGILIMEEGTLIGVVSRDMFYERSGKQYGTEIYHKRPISVMLNSLEHELLILPDTTLITIAVQKALSREVKSIYQPIVIQQPDDEYRLISAMILFLAQSQQLLQVHHQRLFTVDSGNHLSDREAILGFINHVGNQPGFNLAMFTKRHEVRCDHCLRMVNFSIIDIIRSFPQLNRGVVVEEKMGIRTYRMYARHYCLNREIWEIPLHLDANLAYRSQRQARAVESYV